MNMPNPADAAPALRLVDDDAERNAVLSEWDRLAEQLADPDVELTAEEFAPVLALYHKLLRLHAAIDPMAAALVVLLARDASALDPDGDADQQDDGDAGTDEELIEDGFRDFLPREASPRDSGSRQPADRAARRRYVAASNRALNARHRQDPRFQDPNDGTGWPSPRGMMRPAPIGSDEWQEEQAAIQTHLACCAQEDFVDG